MGCIKNLQNAVNIKFRDENTSLSSSRFAAEYRVVGTTFLCCGTFCSDITIVRKMGHSFSINRVSFTVDSKKQDSKDDNNCVAKKELCSTLLHYDIVLALILGGYAFEAYRKSPKMDKIVQTYDGTRIILLCPEFAALNFKGVLNITLQRNKELNRSHSIVEATNIAVVVSILEASKDVMQESTQYSTANATPIDHAARNIWRSDQLLSHVEFSSKIKSCGTHHKPFLLFVQDPLVAALNVSVIVQEKWSQRNIAVGRGAMYINDLRKMHFDDEVTGTVCLPIYSNTTRTVTHRSKDNSKIREIVEVAPACNLIVDVQYIPLDQNSSQSPPLRRMFPQVSDVADGRYLKQICCLDNAETDTQATVWADTGSKQVVIAFRGTEKNRMKDIMANYHTSQVAYLRSNSRISKVEVHEGFMRAFRSVRVALLQVLHSLLTSTNPSECLPQSNWNIFVTGHSLGGALATLLSFELGRIREGLWGSVMDDSAIIYRGKDLFLTILGQADLTMYSYGSPRLGNLEFTQIFNKLVPNSFRLVNFQDLIPSIPKVYCHVGNEIVIDGAKFCGMRNSNCQMFFDNLDGSSIMQHLTPAYFESLKGAASRCTV